MESLNTGLIESGWFIWGIILVIAFPVLVVFLGELSHKLEKGNSQWNGFVRFMQRFVIPQLVLLLIFTKLLEFPADHVAVKIVETSLWIFLIYGAMTLINLMLFTESEESSWRIKVPKLLLDFARALIVALGAAFVLSNIWGFELGKMLAALGVGSIVLGLALQDTLSSLISGFSLVSSRQFRIGDWLEVDGAIGKVININWRTVTLLNRDEDIIIIPNLQLARAKFINYSYPYPRHIERVNFDFSFDDAPHKVKKALIDAALSTDGILTDPAPKVDLISYDEFSVRHQIRFCIQEYKDLPIIRDRFVSSVWYVAKREGITFPTRAHEVINLEPDALETEGLVQENFSILEASPLLQGKDSAILQEMAEHSQRLAFGQGEFVIQQGTHSDDFFILLSGGAVEYYRDSTGESHRLNRLAVGDVFGLVSLIRNSPDEVSVIAMEDTEVLSVQEDNAVRLLQKYPELSGHIESMIETQQQELKDIELLVKKSVAQAIVPRYASPPASSSSPRVPSHSDKVITSSGLLSSAKSAMARKISR
jgi:small-conductance mechanosensitive channel/CRP-like cAMP-binding protein